MWQTSHGRIRIIIRYLRVEVRVTGDISRHTWQGCYGQRLGEDQVVPRVLPDVRLVVIKGTFVLWRRYALY